MTKFSKFFRLALVPFGLLLIVVFSWNTNAFAAQQSVTWTAPVNRSNTGDKSVYASVAYDAQGKTHIIWLEYNPTGESSRLMYTNNIDGSFISPYQVVDNAGKNVEHITALAVETNRVHVFYTNSGKSLRHTVMTLSGSRPSNGATTTLSGGRGYAPAATVDTSGRVHLVFIDNRTGTYQVYHRIWTDGSWDGSRLIRATGRTQDSPSIVATSDGRIHVLFSVDGSPLSYAIFSNGGWSNSNSPADAYGNISGLATDGTTLFAVWSNKEHRVLYAENSGNGWRDRQQISEGSNWSDYPTITYSSGNQRVYTAWSVFESPRTQIVVREIIPGVTLNDIVTIGNTVPSIWPRAAASANEVSILWQDKSPGAEEIRHVTAVTKVPPTPTPIPSPTPLPPSGSLQLSDPNPVTGQNGELYTNETRVNAVIRNTGGSQANQYGLSDGGDPGDPNNAFNDNGQPVQFSLNTSDGSCRMHQVNGRLKGSSGISQIFSDSIIYDPTVEAEIQARNPNLRTDVPTETPGNQARAAGAPIDFGDPNYTNLSLFYLSLRNASNECSGLRSYTLNFTSAPGGVTIPEAETKPLISGGPGTAFLPGTVQGTYGFSIALSDNAGNTRTYPSNGSFNMTYDNVAPEVSLATGSKITPTEIRDGFVTVDLSNVKVTDNLYRNSGRQYYGAWIVVRKAGETPSDVDWQLKGVPIAGDVSNLKWNMAMGLSDAFEPGQRYQMFIRFIDGAVNVSDQTIVTEPIQINDLEGPQTFLPLVFTR